MHVVSCPTGIRWTRRCGKQTSSFGDHVGRWAWGSKNRTTMVNECSERRDTSNRSTQKGNEAPSIGFCDSRAAGPRTACQHLANRAMTGNTAAVEQHVGAGTDLESKEDNGGGTAEFGVWSSRCEQLWAHVPGLTSLGVESIEFDDKLAGASIHGYESLG